MHCFGCNVGLTLWDVADYVKNSFFSKKERKKKEDHRTIKMLIKKVFIPGLAELLAELIVEENVYLAFEDTINEHRCSFQFPISDLFKILLIRRTFTTICIAGIRRGVVKKIGLFVL